MILWLNGPYGVGKSTLAEALHAMLPHSFIFDAEQVGNAIRDSMPDCLFRETFEEYPLWLHACVQLLKEISCGYPGHVLVPMTLVQPCSMQIFEQLRQVGVDVRHVILQAPADEILDRILQRGEAENCWCAQKIAPCLEGQEALSCDFRLDAMKAPEELAQHIINVCKL